MPEEKEPTNTGIGESPDRITTVKREVIKLKREIADSDNPREKCDKYQVLIPIELQRMKDTMIDAVFDDCKVLDNGIKVSEAETLYIEYVKIYSKIHLPKVRGIGTLIAGLNPGTKITIDDQPYMTVYNDSSLNNFLEMAVTYAYEFKADMYSNLEIKISPFINIGWDVDDSDNTMTPVKLASRYQ